MKALSNLFLSAEFLQEKETAEAVQRWLLKEKTSGLTKFYPNLEALSIVSTLPIGSPLRDITKQTIELHNDFEQSVIEGLIDWFFSNYKGLALTELINTIMERAIKSAS
ncbi:hypothetical protein [Marinomonas algicola]|uniref:hypothetical protein n=1 Tax=Marinomonas algicola TaxID=2773454 RepID=UPI00174AE71B|nr:hypothetical protein [Marinomonas algicola]